jgi:hypothetical protein
MMTTMPPGAVIFPCLSIAEVVVVPIATASQQVLLSRKRTNQCGPIDLSVSKVQYN